MIINGIEENDLREAEEFGLTDKPNNRTKAVFVAIKQKEILVTRRLANLFDLPEETDVIANWHGKNRTDAFRMTVGQLKKLSEK